MSAHKSSHESTTTYEAGATNRKVQLAGFQRLLSQMSVEEPSTDQTHLMRLAEERVHAYTKTKTSREVRDEGPTLYQHVCELLAPFEFTHKASWIALWNHLLCDSVTTTTAATTTTDLRIHLEAISSVALNNELKRLIQRDIRTPSKYKGILKRVLNLGDTFSSLFAEVDLTSVERAQRDHNREQEARRIAALELLLTSEPPSSSEDEYVSAFYSHVRQLSDPLLRNTYFNRILTQLTKAPPSNLFVQLYDRLVNYEIVTTVHPALTAYLAKNPIDFFAHSLRHMPLLLEPHSNFKGSTAVLDPWQRQTLKAIKAGSNIFLNLPTSAGKTVVSSGILEDYTNAWFIVPKLPLAEQLTGILLATLMDKEARKGSEFQRNVRLEAEGASYRRFQKAKDNIVVAMPRRMWELLHADKKFPKPQFIALDEGHTIGCPEQGPYYEYILKYAAFHGIPFMNLTATMRDEDSVRNREWMERLTGTTLFTVVQKRRFFNQQYKEFRVDPETQKVTTVLVDPLKYLTKEVLRSPTFRNLGLVPGEVLRLYERLTDFPRVKAETRMPTLDNVEVLEEELFRHLASKSDAELDALLAGGHGVAKGHALTPYQVYMTLRAMKAEQKPLLLFKMDSLACMRFFLTLVHLAQDMSKLVYGNFADDQTIITQFLEEPESIMDCMAEGEKAEEHAEMMRARRDVLYATKYRPRLVQFYKEYLEVMPEDVAADCEAFNTKYGASLTHKFILAKRTKHAMKQLSKTAETIRLRTDYAIHDDIKISTYSSSTVMKEIRNQINEELDHQRSGDASFVDMRTLDPAFDDFNNMEETVHWKKYDPVKREWRRTGDTETRRFGRPWKSGLVETANSRYPDREYTYKISYEHPVLLGIECGLLFYNELLNPAFTRICQLLLSKHPLIAVSDKGLIVGVNYQIRGVWFQGGFQGEPEEELDDTQAQQGKGRAGRRGYDREATIYMSGVNAKNVLIPQYKPVVPNGPARMEPLVEGEDEAFRRFVLTEERVATKKGPEAVVPLPTEGVANPVVTPSGGQESKVELPDEETMKGMSWEEWG